MTEYREAEKAREETDLSQEGFATFWLLSRQGVGQAESVAREVMAAFKRYPHWQSSSGHERQVRTAIYKALLSADVSEVPEQAERILQMLRRTG